MSGFSSAFKSAMVDCEIYRNGSKVAIYKGLIHDSKDYNCINFDSNVDVQVDDDIYCPMKKKHYKIVNTDIALFRGEPHRLDAYFENNFTKPTSNMTFNTYNPTNSVIGAQQNVTMNINDCYNNLQNQIEHLGNEDKTELYELLECLKSETSKEQISKSIFSKFQNLLIKHGTWLIPSISQLLAAWIQRG